MATRSQSKNKKTAARRPINPVIWVEIPVMNMNRAKTFYKKMFGLKFKMIKMYGYQLALFPMAPDRVGSGGALVYGETYTPSYNGPLIYFSTQNIAGSLEKAVQGGGALIQDKKSIGHFGFVAYFEDPEGNRIGLHSMK